MDNDTFINNRKVLHEFVKTGVLSESFISENPNLLLQLEDKAKSLLLEGEKPSAVKTKLQLYTKYKHLLPKMSHLFTNLEPEEN